MACRYAASRRPEPVPISRNEKRAGVKNLCNSRTSDPDSHRPPGARRSTRACRAAVSAAVLLVIQGHPFTTNVLAQTPSSARPAAERQGDSTGIVRPGDVIRLKVWREPDMSGDISVNDAGVATLPRLGAIQVSELSADSLQRYLVNTYAKDLRDPAIDVVVLRRVTILGAVRNPNVYQIDPTMTVADALALAGGAAPDGRQDRVELRRQGQANSIRLFRGQRLAETPLRSGDELYVPERSWLSRNTGLVLGGVGTLTSILFLVFR